VGITCTHGDLLYLLGVVAAVRDLVRVRVRVRV